MGSCLRSKETPYPSLTANGLALTQYKRHPIWPVIIAGTNNLLKLAYLLPYTKRQVEAGWLGPIFLQKL